MYDERFESIGIAIQTTRASLFFRSPSSSLNTLFSRQLLSLYALSRKRMHVGQIDRSARGVANVRQQIARFDRLLAQKLRQRARRSRLQVVKLSQSGSVLVVVGQAPAVRVNVGRPAALAEFGPGRHGKLQRSGAVHAEQLTSQGCRHRR